MDGDRIEVFRLPLVIRRPRIIPSRILALTGRARAEAWPIDDIHADPWRSA